MTIISDLKNATHFGVENEREDSLNMIIWNEIVSIDISDTHVKHVKKIKFKIKISATGILTDNEYDNLEILNFLIREKSHYTSCICLISKKLLMDEDIVQYLEIEAIITEVHEENSGGSKYDALMTFLPPFAAENTSPFLSVAGQGTYWDYLNNQLMNSPKANSEFTLRFSYKALFDLNLVNTNHVITGAFNVDFKNGQSPESDE